MSHELNNIHIYKLKISKLATVNCYYKLLVPYLFIYKNIIINYHLGLYLRDIHVLAQFIDRKFFSLWKGNTKIKVKNKQCF